MNKKVLQLTTYLNIGGLERVIFTLCCGLRDLKWAPHVFVYQQTTSALEQTFTDNKIPTHFIDKGEGFSFSTVFKIRQYMKKNKIDLIHSHDLGALIYAVFVKIVMCGKVKIVHTQHSFQHLKNNPRQKFYERIFPKFANRIVVVSVELKKTYIEHGINGEKINVVQNGVDFTVVKKPATKAEMAQATHLPASIAAKRWFLSLARISPIKGQLNVLRVWNEIPKTERKDAVLFFVGPTLDNKYEAELKRVADDSVFFIGPSMNPEWWLQASDVFVSGSDFEGLPLSGLEAAAAGCALLLSDIPGHKIFEGLATFFISNTKQAAASFIPLLNAIEPESSVQRAVRERLSKENGIERMIQAYEAEYKQLL